MRTNACTPIANWRNRLVLFDDVDISLPVERVQEGRAVVLQTVIRAANRKSVEQIHHEIRGLQSKELVETPWGRWLRWYVLIPAFIRRLFFRIAAKLPKVLKKLTARSWSLQSACSEPEPDGESRSRAIRFP